MKDSFRVRCLVGIAAVSFLLLLLSGCDETGYDLLDPDSAGVWTRYTAANSGLPGDEIWDMEVDGEGNLWISCFGEGLARYSGDAWTTYTTSNSSILNDSVTALETTTDGSIIVGTSNGVAILDASGIWSSYKDPLVTTMEIYSVRSTSDGSIWIGTFNEGLYISESSVVSHSTSGFTVYAFEEDNLGNVWMGTNTGLWLWNGIAWTDISSTGGLPEGGVSSLYIDSRRRLWIGVLDAEKVYWRDNTGIHSLSLMTGLSENVIWDICEDRNGDIWFATYGGGLIRYDGVVPHSYKDYNKFTSEVFAEDNVNCIARDNDGNMWFGLTTKGLVKYTLPLN